MLRNTLRISLLACATLVACFPNPTDPVGTTTSASTTTTGFTCEASSPDTSSSGPTSTSLPSDLSTTSADSGGSSGTYTTMVETSASTGADLGTTGDGSTGAPLACPIGPGSNFGPCVDGKCETSMYCLEVPAGTMCMADCDVCTGANACVSELSLDGSTDCMTKGCVLKCQDDFSCSTGMRCDSLTSICVWPEATTCGLVPGGPWGPCINNECPNSAHSTTCLHGAKGSYCAPDCSLGCPELGCDDAVGQCDENYLCGASCLVNADCPAAGMVCDDELGACVWPD